MSKSFGRSGDSGTLTPFLVQCFMYEARAIGGALQASHEGEVEVHPAASFPTS